MRWLIFAVLVGCLSETENLEDLDKRAKHCGIIPENCAATADLTPVVTCMNDALASGALADMIWQVEEDGHDYYIVTEGDHFRIFTAPYECPDGPQVSDENTCTGPLEATTTAACGEDLQLKIDGC